MTTETELSPQVLLRDLRELLTDEDHWTQGALARDAENRWVDPDAPSATCWCLMGAIQHIRERRKCDARGPSGYIPLQVLSSLNRAEWQLEDMLCGIAREHARQENNQDYDLFDFNDAPKRKQSDIFALLDAAIRRAA